MIDCNYSPSGRDDDQRSDVLVTVYDLDGTLISVNTFRLWVRFLISNALHALPVAQVPLLGLLATLRYCRILSHAAFKRELSRMRVRPWLVERFASQIAPFARPELLHALREDKSDVRILATAAPAVYVGPLLRRLSLSFDTVIASGFHESGFLPMVGTEKRDAVVAYLRTLELRRTYRLRFYTDSREDLPLARLADQTTLFARSAIDYNAFTSAGIPIDLRSDPSQWDAAALSRLDLSNTKAFEAACVQLYSMFCARFGKPTAILGIATGGYVVAQQIAKLDERISLHKVTCTRGGISHDRAVRARVAGVLPSRLQWAVRALEIKLVDATRRSAKQASRRGKFRETSVEPPLPVISSDPSLVMVVDDAIDTGTTMRQVMEHLTTEGSSREIHSAVLAVSLTRPEIWPGVALRYRALVRGPWSVDAHA